MLAESSRSARAELASARGVLAETVAETVAESRARVLVGCGARPRMSRARGATHARNDGRPARCPGSMWEFEIVTNFERN